MIESGFSSAVFRTAPRPSGTGTRFFPATARSHAVPFHFGQPCNPFHRRAADGARDALFFADQPIRDAPPNRTRDVPHLALRFDHRRGGFRVPQGICLLESVLGFTRCFTNRFG
jgi:hypothetical protein